MGELVDARGLACPAPVVKTRDVLKKGASDIEVLVDNPTARDNVCRFASSQGCGVEVREEGDIFRIAVTVPAGEAGVMVEQTTAGDRMRSVVVLNGDVMGRGSEELGAILIKAFLNTLAENEPPPWRMVLFNSGVKLAMEGADTVQAFQDLESMGVEILVCGTCLDFFGLKEKLAVGTVSNMYDILTTMFSATNSITI
jgi:selenium metabolism protein YedF